MMYKLILQQNNKYELSVYILDGMKFIIITTKL